MVRRVRAGESYRQVARTLRVSVSVVVRWVERAGGQRLDRVDWGDRSRRPKHMRQTSAPVVRAILRAREWLQRHEALGEYGAAAIRRHLLAGGMEVPSERTIARWVARSGRAPPARIRRLAPPLGWYLPRVAHAHAELDRVDVIEGLRLQNYGTFEVLNALSLRGGLPGSHVAKRITTVAVRTWLQQHWERHGRPDYVQFDNDTIFSGAHAQRNYMGRLVHWCLCVGVVPVFAPPYETGFQAAVEAYNRHWQQRVWHRWHHRSMRGLTRRSNAFVRAYHHREIQRRPLMQSLRKAWINPLHEPIESTLILLRRLDENGALKLFAQSTKVDPDWAHRLVRCEVNVIKQTVKIYRISRSDPHYQPALATRRISMRLVPWWKPPR